jgi:hypothetical protein
MVCSILNTPTVENVITKSKNNSNGLRIIEPASQSCKLTIDFTDHSPKQKYSVCITNYNSIDTIRDFFESIFKYLDDRFEVVVCDNCSKDGSGTILEEYARRGKIKLIIEETSRGKGRQVSFESSTCEYIISGIDTDDRLRSDIYDFIKIYHQNHEGFMLSAGTIHIIPRQLVNEIGGWRDLKWGEDIDFRQRATALGKQRELEYKIKLVERGHNKRNLLTRFSQMYDASLCSYKIGTSIIDQTKMFVWYYKPAMLALALLVSVVCKCKKVPRFKYEPSDSDIRENIPAPCSQLKNK